MRLNLLVLSGNHTGEQRCVEPPGGAVGNAPECAVQLSDPTLSRQHAELTYRAGQWWLAPVSAEHLLLLDDRRIAATPTALVDAGKLQIGPVTLQYWQQAATPQVSLSATTEIKRSRRTLGSLPTRLAVGIDEPDEIAEPSDEPAAALHDLPTLMLDAIAGVPQPPHEAEGGVVSHLRSQVAQLEKECAGLRAVESQLKQELELLQPWVSPPNPTMSPAVRRRDAVKLIQDLTQMLKDATQAMHTSQSERLRKQLREATLAVEHLRALFS